nr:hypothetical protein [Nocardia amamiensis]
MAYEIHQLHSVRRLPLVARINAVDLIDSYRFGIARRGGDQLAAEECLERLGQFNADVVLFEVDLLEEGLVEQAPDAAVGLQVARIAVAGVVQRSTQVVLNDLDVEQAGLQVCLDPGQLPGDAVLFVFHQIERDRSGVVGLEQLGPLIEQALLLPVQLPRFTVGSFSAGGQFAPEAGFDLFAQFRHQLDGLVLIFDQFFDALDQHRLALAVAPLLVATQADEVRVNGAVPILGVGDNEPAAASATEDRRFEVVRMLALLLSVDP